ncbi:MAG: type II toxin-antitoxin system RelE/ParE family toxin [Pseudomonadota bacterium]
MIKGFKDKRAARIFSGEFAKGLPAYIQQRARQKLVLLNAAAVLQDLRSPPANRLEPLRGERLGQYSIRINDQWRVCFRWEGNHAFDVEIADYH